MVSVQTENHSPSSWRSRVPITLLATAGLLIASYLAAYQLGLVREVWEPFFGRGSERVLHSFMSRILPLPDAALGAIGYAFEVMASLIGGANRYRARTRVVLFYGLVVAALAITAIALTAIQFFVVQAACTLCLTSAAISLVVAFLARAEVFAAVHLLYAKRKTK